MSVCVCVVNLKKDPFASKNPIMLTKFPRTQWNIQFSSVAQSCLTLCFPIGLEHDRLPCPSPTPGACSNSCPSSRWWHPTISSSVIPFSSCLQSFPASGSFLVSHFFASGGQSVGDSASASVLPMNIQDWLPLGLSDLISLLSKGLSRVFSKTYIWNSSNEMDETGVYYTEWSKPERKTPIQYTNAYIWNLERW